MSQSRKENLENLYKLRDKLNEKQNEVIVRGFGLYDKVHFNPKKTGIVDDNKEKDKTDIELNNAIKQLDESKIEDELVKVNGKIKDLEIEIYGKQLTSPPFRNSK